MVLLQRKLYFSKFPEGVQHFPVGGGGGGPNAIFYRNPYNLWFSRGGGPDLLSPPLDPHLHINGWPYQRCKPEIKYLHHLHLFCK